MNAKIPTDPPTDEQPQAAFRFTPKELAVLEAGMREHTQRMKQMQSEPTLSDWMTAEPDKFLAAIAAMFEGELSSMLCDVLMGDHRPVRERLAEKMEKLLDAEINEGREWVRDWLRERTQGMEE